MHTVYARKTLSHAYNPMRWSEALYPSLSNVPELQEYSMTVKKIHMESPPWSQNGLLNETQSTFHYRHMLEE